MIRPLDRLTGSRLTDTPLAFISRFQLNLYQLLSTPTNIYQPQSASVNLRKPQSISAKLSQSQWTLIIFYQLLSSLNNQYKPISTSIKLCKNLTTIGKLSAPLLISVNLSQSQLNSVHHSVCKATSNTLNYLSRICDKMSTKINLIQFQSISCNLSQLQSS